VFQTSWLHSILHDDVPAAAAQVRTCADPLNEGTDNSSASEPAPLTINGTELKALADFLCAAFHQAQTAGAHMSMETPAPVSNTAISFCGFERFAHRWPGVFVGLLHLLFPLVGRAQSFMLEEMELTAKHVLHRTEELRSQVHVQAQDLQRRRISRLYTRYLHPWQEMRRRRMSSACNTSAAASAT